MKAPKQVVRWRKSPLLFVLEVFGPGYLEETGETLVPDKWQEKVLRYLVEHEPHDDCDGSPATHIGIRAAKGPGKSTEDAWIIWWFLFCHPYPNVAAMSITADNLRDNLWKELAVWYGRAPLLQSAFELTGERIVPRGDEDMQKRWFCSARSFPQKPDKSQQSATVAGLHSRYVMVAIDEAGDVPPGVLTAAEGIFLSEHDRALVLLTGNCTSMSGALYDATVQRGHRYHVVRVTGDPDDPERSVRMDIEECRKLIADHGREDPVVMINVLGEFPLVGIDKLLGPNEVTASENRTVDRRIVDQEPQIFALDVARHGMDSSTLTRRQGPVAQKASVWRIDDLMVLADQVAAILAAEKPDALIVGATGIGWGVVDRLRQLGWGPILIAIDEGKSARDPRFADVRTEMWCNLAGWVKSVGCLPKNDPELRAELLAPGKRQKFLRGMTREILDPSEIIRKLLGRSPDRATSLALTFAAPVAPRGLQEAEHRKRFARTDFNPWEHLRGGG